MPMRSPSRKLEAPNGITMNSCKSTLLSACSPPFRMFIIGTGKVRALGTADVAVEREAGFFRGGFGHGQ